MSNANFMELPPKSLARVHRRWFSGTVCFIDPLAFGVVPPFFSALTQDEEEVMGAAFRPSYWAQTLAKDAKGWVEGCCLHRKVVHIYLSLYIYIFIFFFWSNSCNIFHDFQKCCVLYIKMLRFRETFTWNHTKPCTRKPRSCWTLQQWKGRTPHSQCMRMGSREDEVVDGIGLTSRHPGPSGLLKRKGELSSKEGFTNLRYLGWLTSQSTIQNPFAGCLLTFKCPTSIAKAMDLGEAHSEHGARGEFFVSRPGSLKTAVVRCTVLLDWCTSTGHIFVGS